MGLRYDNLVFHFIYSENTYINFRKFIRKTNKIVLTIHQPYEWFDNELWKKKLRSADRIIILSETEKQKFLDLLGGDKVEFIPHGIDVDFYKPSDIQKPTGQILTVGNWLRDFNFADKVYQEIKKKNPNVIINIVSNLENMKFISDNSRINFMSGISDEELRKLYQQSSVLFLPLTRFTANNALLEAASSGCNILIASNGQDKSYLPEKYISILEMDVNRVVERIMEMLNNPVVEAKQLREYVQKEYSWKVIAQQTESIFKKI
jgi:glycosyltransferase involved in cell wall biosynthesis